MNAWKASNPHAAYLYRQMDAKGNWRRKKTHTHTREMARIARQIAAGSLKRENGLAP